MKLRILAYGAFFIYLGFTAYRDLLVRGAATCGRQDQIPSQRPPEQLPVSIGKHFDALEKAPDPAAYLMTAWEKAGFRPRVDDLVVGGRRAHRWSVEIPGRGAGEMEFSVSLHHKEALSLLIGISAAFQITKREQTLRFSSYEITPDSGEPGAASGAAPDRALIFVTTLFSDRAEQEAHIPSLFRSYLPPDKQSGYFYGDFKSRGLVNVLGGLYETFSPHRSFCLKDFPFLPPAPPFGFPAFRSNHGQSVFFRGGDRKANSPEQLGEMGQTWFNILNYLAEIPAVT